MKLKLAYLFDDY